MTYTPRIPGKGFKKKIAKLQAENDALRIQLAETERENETLLDVIQNMGKPSSGQIIQPSFFKEYVKLINEHQGKMALSIREYIKIHGTREAAKVSESAPSDKTVIHPG